MRKSCLFLFYIVCAHMLLAQDTVNFIPPLKVPLYLSGTFGELRTNHFHSGIDIKTQQREGLEVVSIADGYVSRIKVSPVGYGNALYITHPNGYTSVYGHLSRYNKVIQDFIKELQYEKESFEVEVFPDPHKFPVKQGEVVAYSGNSGGSGGPHLHFEIRETDTEIPINPLLFNFPIKDNIAPSVDFVQVYTCNKAYQPQHQTVRLKKSGNRYSPNAAHDTVAVAADQVYLGIKTIDQSNGSANRNGVFQITLKADGDTVYDFDFTQFSFDEWRYINAHIDYQEDVKSRQNIHMLHLQPANKLSIYNTTNNNGWIELSPNPIPVSITVADAYGNTSTVAFFLKSTGNNCPQQQQTIVAGETILPFQENRFSLLGAEIVLPPMAVYDTMPVNFKESGQGRFSKAYTVSNHHIPVHYAFDIAITAENLPEQLKAKAGIVREAGGRKTFLTAKWLNDTTLIASSNSFGRFYVDLDETPPNISPISLSRRLQFRIRDNLSGIKSYTATLDGKWILMEYDTKNNLLSHLFDERTKPGTHEFVLEVTDQTGNTAIYRNNITR